MNIIVAVDKDWAIGRGGELLYIIPKDLEHFRDLTIGRCVVYGHNTLKTFPGGKPLARRDNIILTKDKDFEADAMIAHNLGELKVFLRDYPAEEVFVIGGASIYGQLLPYCDTAYVTKIDASSEGADVFFPKNLDDESNWRVIEDGPPQQSDDGLWYRFVTYRNDAAQDF